MVKLPCFKEFLPFLIGKGKRDEDGAGDRVSGGPPGLRPLRLEQEANI